MSGDPVGKLGKGFADVVTFGGFSKAEEEIETAKKLAAKTEADQAKQLADIEAEEKRAAADKEAGKKTLLANAAIDKKKKTGRKSTILTDALGTTGGQTTEKKSLLGL